MATYVPAKKNTAYIFYVSLVSQANPFIYQANPTLAAGDVKVATDDAAPGNVTDIPVVDGDFTKRVKVTLTAGEMNGDNITVIFSDAAGDEWCDLTVNIQTVAAQIDDIDAKTTNLPADPADASDIAAAIASIPELTQDEVRDTVIVGTYTIQQILALALACFAGKVSGGGSGTLTYRDITDADNILVMTILNADGDRDASVINFGATLP